LSFFAISIGSAMARSVGGGSPSLWLHGPSSRASTPR